MTILELLLISIGLSMDAFAVSICKGLATKKYSLKNSFIVGLYFGTFQALMPLLGYFIGNNLGFLIIEFDHWVAFALLNFIGIKMIKDSNKEENINDNLKFKEMFILSIATSIDALAIGITLSFLKAKLLFSVATIGIITFTLSSIGVYIGYKTMKNSKLRAEILGGIILIIIGFKILLDHLL